MQLLKRDCCFSRTAVSQKQNSFTAARIRTKGRLCKYRPEKVLIFSLSHEAHAASRFVMEHPQTRIQPGRSAPFHFFEVLEQHVAWVAYSFLRAAVGFTSAIWLHDGFWVAPCTTDEILLELHHHLSAEFGFAASDPPLMRCDPLRHKRDQLLAQLAAQTAFTGYVPAGAEVLHPLPPIVRIWRKRLYQAANEEHQVALEQRLSKRARVVNSTKRRRL